MVVPLEKELLTSLNEIELLGYHGEMEGIIATNPGGKRLRNLLAADEKQSGTSKLIGNSPRNLTPKYRLDILEYDLQAIADELALCLAQAHIYIPLVLQRKTPVFAFSTAVKLACYHLDFGFRLASSGWDRIALVLTLAFDLNQQKKWNLKRVLEKLNKIDGLRDNTNLKWLDTFHSNEFQELDGEQLGIRHETTHQITLLARYRFEYVEGFSTQSQEQEYKLKEWYGSLLDHYHHYINFSFR